MKGTIQSHFTDEQLVKQIQEGNNTAMGIIYSRYYQQVCNKCFSYAKDTDNACDMAQDIMVKVMDKIKDFKGDAKFSGARQTSLIDQ
jgi:RNA polymerase sigma-70 factor (ECF subfamily)